MKKKLFLFGLLLPLAVIPAFTSSCVNISYIKFKTLNNVEVNWTYDNAASSKTGFKKLYGGDKKINEGNYVIFLGCTGKLGTGYYNNIGGSTGTAEWNEGAFTTSNVLTSGFFDKKLKTNPSEDSLSVLDSTSQIFTKNFKYVESAEDYDKSDFQKGYETWKNGGTSGITKDYDINFFVFLAQPKAMHYINGASYEEPVYESPKMQSDPIFYVSPFDTWQSSDFTNGYFNSEPSGESKKKNQNSWEKHHQVGEYIRNDQEAKEYRAMVNFLQKISPTTFAGKDGTDDPFVIYVKNGKPNKLSTIDNFQSDIDSVWPDESLDD